MGKVLSFPTVLETERGAFQLFAEENNRDDAHANRELADASRPELPGGGCAFALNG